MTKYLVMLLAALVLFGAQAQAGDSQLDKAKGIYKQFCSHCHGIDMVNPGTSSFDLRKFPQNDKPRFVSSVTKGKGDMPAWGDVLYPEELELLWYLVSTRNGKEPPPSDSAKASEPADAADATEAPEQAAQAPAPAAETQANLIKPGTLTACLAKNGGVMSSRRAGGGAGLDYELVKALAARMGLALDIAWFESEQEEESTPIREIYAMLAYPVCDVVPGFALYETSLSAFYRTRAALPRWDDRPAHLGHGFQVDLQPISVSDPYARMEMGVVYRSPEFDRRIERIADMEGLRIGVEQGTLAGVLTLRQGTERMVREAVTLNPGPDFLWKLEQGAFDAALVTVGAYDFHKKQNFVSTLTLDDYRHPIGFNLSLALLKRNRALLDIIDPEIQAMLADGRLAALAKKSQVTYAPPRAPWVMHHLTMQDIMAMR